MLRIEQHDRDASAMRYVYPVVSRRAGGVSVGLNLNVNNACNWACVYCQVPGLTRGGPPAVDLALLRDELTRLLDDILDGDFLTREAPPEMRRLADVAFSGNGEPTTAAEFPEAVEVVLGVLAQRGLLGKLPVRLITNGSMAHRSAVRAALVRLGAAGGEIWFKIDRGTDAEIHAVNGSEISLATLERNLALTATLAPVWLQTCWFGDATGQPTAAAVDAYVALVARHRERLRGVHLYGIARPSMQPGAAALVRLPLADLDAVAGRLRALGLAVTTSE